MASNRKKFAIAPVSDADGIAQSQTPAAGGEQSLTLNGASVSGGKATFTTPHQISITSVADETSRTFTVTGKDEGGQPYTETITGANAGSAVSTAYFLEVSSITVDDDTAGAITVGTNGKCVTPWYPTSRNTVIGFSVELSSGASLTYSVQHTMDDIQDIDATITALEHDTITSQTTTQDGNYEYPSSAIRAIVTAFTSGTLEFNILTARR